MSKMRILMPAVAAAVLALAACGGKGGLPAASTLPAALQPYTGPQALADFTWGQAYLAESQYLGPATFGSLSVNVLVRMRDERGLLAYAQAASDPASPVYRHFLTPQEIGARFGASQSDYNAVANYFAAHGMGVGGWPQREALVVSGTQAQFEAAFGTKFGFYRRAGQTFVAPVQAPHFSQPLPVTSVTHLVAATIARSYLIRASNTSFAGYSPAQIANGFDYSGAWSAGFDGTGIDIGIIGTGPISSADVPEYGKLFKAREATVTLVPASPQPASTPNGNTGTGSVDPNPNGLATPPPVTDTCSGGTSEAPSATCNPEDGEAQLDTEQAASLAPGASVLFYLAFNTLDCSYIGAPSTCVGAQGLAIADDEIQQAIADDTADAISLSYGGGESNTIGGGYLNSNGTGIGPTEFASLAAEGIAVFVSSGDTGAESCQDPNTGAPLAQPCVSYPASDPSVVGVGGVNAPMDNTGKLLGDITAWADQTTGGGDGSFANNVGSGGGVSGVFTAPAWQAKNVPGVTMREVPDLALMADPATGPALLMNANFKDAGIGPSGGTSAAAPEAAAMWALVLDACKASPSCATASGPHPYRLGNPDPLIYAIYGQAYAGTTGGPSAFTPGLPYAQVFYDVLYGNNAALPPNPTPSSTPIAGCCLAGPGYDEVTGLGVPFAGHLIQGITGTKAP